MTLLSKQEEEARNCLRVGSVLIDPKYLPKESNPEEKLKTRCRECWAMRAHFPAWVQEYVKKWADAGKPALTKAEEDFA